MEVRQLTYTSTAKGWGIERLLGAPRDKERAMFNSISGESETDSVLYTFDVSDDAYILARSVPYGTDSHNRSRYYVHGYVFPFGEGNELLENYPALLGWDYFACGENDALYEIKDLPAPFMGRVICKDLHCLIECVYEAILERKCVEIYTDEPDRELFIRKVMNTVYSYLPLSLRKFVSFGSNTGKIMRTIVATGRFTALSGIKYNFTTGEVSGLSGKYDSFVSAVISENKEAYLTELERRIKDSLTYRSSDTGVVDYSIKSIMFEAGLCEAATAENAVSRLVEVLAKNQYNNQAHVSAICSYLDVIRSGGVTTVKALDTKLVEVFKKTHSTELKEKIAAHIVKKYSFADDKSSFDAILSYEAIDYDMYVMVTEQAVLHGSDEFLRFCALRAAENAEYSLFIKENCSESCVQSVTEEIARLIDVSASRKQLIEAIMRTALHSDTVKAIINSPKSAELGWDYVCVAYADADNFEIYRSLEQSLIASCEKIFYREIANHPSQGLKVLDNIHQNLKYDIYLYVEKTLAATLGKELLEEFYVKVISTNAHTANIFEAQKNRMLQLGLSADRYVQQVLETYSAVCFADGEKNGDSAGVTIKRIAGFAGADYLKDNSAVHKVKKAFWEHFDWNNFSFTDDIRFMEISDDKASRLANSIMHLYDYVSGKNDSYDTEEFKNLADSLCRPNPLLTKKAQDSILNMLKKHTTESFSHDTEVCLLINYSNRRGNVNLKDAELTSAVLLDYLTHYDDDGCCMLDMPGVFAGLYNYVRDMLRKEDLDATDDYLKVLMLMQSQSRSKGYSTERLIHGILAHLFITGIIVAVMALIILFNIRGAFATTLEYILALAGIFTVCRRVYGGGVSLKVYVCDVLLITAIFVLLFIISFM